ncbi:MAG: metallophosphoesterase [Firmicutes bacterium]|nr:metallophosphoesterase [Bacillota bacterium]
MKILAVSDTHGKLNKLREIMPKLKNLDLILHAGDYGSDGRKIEKEFGIPVISVRGNCDGGGRNDFEIVETEFGRIFLTHGHEQGAGYSRDNLVYRALEEGCCAAVYGHTHISENILVPGSSGAGKNTSEFRLINPGSLSLPRDGSGGSYAIIRTSEESLDASIVYYNTVAGKESLKSGVLRNMLNYSDRF